MVDDRAPTARAVARRAVMARITEEGRRQLARDGAAGLSLRSVARELGMVSSGIYRYVASRDELLTLLIVESYDDLAATMDRALRRADRSGAGPRDRWRAVATALRTWARERPEEYALLYGSPVPGYAAPTGTIAPATRVYAALAAASGRPGGPDRPVPPSLVADAAAAAEVVGLDAEPGGVLAAFGAWTRLFGVVSFEVFGHLTNVVGDLDAYFAVQVDSMADSLGLPAA